MRGEIGASKATNQGEPICHGLDLPSAGFVWPGDFTGPLPSNTWVEEALPGSTWVEEEGGAAFDALTGSFSSIHEWIRSRESPSKIQTSLLGDIHVARFDSPCPAQCTVGLLPGLKESLYEYAPLIYEFLKRGCHVVAMDLPSQGDSERVIASEPLKIHLPEGGFESGCEATYVFLKEHVLRDRQSAGHRTHLFAHSTGAAYGLCALTRHPVGASYLGSSFSSVVMSSPLWSVPQARLAAANIDFQELEQGVAYVQKPAEEYASPELEAYPGYLQDELPDNLGETGRRTVFDQQVTAADILFRLQGRWDYPGTRSNGPTKGWVSNMSAGLSNLREQIHCNRDDTNCFGNLLILQRDRTKWGPDPYVDLAAVGRLCEIFNGESPDLPDDSGRQIQVPLVSGEERLIAPGRAGTCKIENLPIFHSFMTAPREIKVTALFKIFQHFDLNTSTSSLLPTPSSVLAQE